MHELIKTKCVFVCEFWKIMHEIKWERVALFVIGGLFLDANESIFEAVSACVTYCRSLIKLQRLIIFENFEYS